MVGIASDKINTKCGKRTPWYIFGTLLVIPAYLGLFTFPSFIKYHDEVLDDKTINRVFDDKNLVFWWYLSCPAIFNVGWASV